MNCDVCERDFCWFAELFWSGRYIHRDTLFRKVERKQYLCKDCLKREEEIYEKYNKDAD